MNNIICLILSLPKSFYWSVKFYGMKGLSCPLLVRYNTIMNIKGRFIPPPYGKRRNKIGFGGSPCVSFGKTIISVSYGGSLFFKGSFILSEGCVVRIEKQGALSLGDNFYANKNCFFSVDKRVSLGDNVLCGWNVQIRDSDGHSVFTNGVKHSDSEDVFVGKHCWLASDVVIMKGVHIADDNVVAFGSRVLRGCETSNNLLAGFPAKVVKTGVSWMV